MKFRASACFSILMTVLLGRQVVLGVEHNSANHSSLLLRYDHPCDIKTYRLHAMPLGNGCLGAMFSGGPAQDVILLNHDRLRPNTYREKGRGAKPDALKTIRRLYLAGKHGEAQKAYDKLTADVGSVRELNTYHSVGDLLLNFQPLGKVHDYQRTLNMQSGVGRVTYRAGDIDFNRTYFVSVPDDMLVVNLKASRPGSINTTIGLGRPPVKDCILYASAQDSLIKLAGQYDEGTTFEVELRVVNRGGTVKTVSSSYHGMGKDIKNGNSKFAIPLTSLAIHRADEITLLCSVRVENPLVPDNRTSCVSFPRTDKDFHTLLARHTAEHKKAFGRTCLKLGGKQAPSNNPPSTESLVLAARRGKISPRLVEAVFQFGRYQLLASSRPGCRPANLQGLWSHGFEPGWQCRYQLDMNVQMCYWPANPTGLHSCNLPLFDLLDSLLPAAERHARDKYGCRGILLPVGIDETNVRYPSCSETQGIAGWMAQHYWDHYRFTGNRKFLAERAYPYMKLVGDFFEDLLFKGKDGRYVILPSASPENTPWGRTGRITMNSTMDVAIARELFTNLISTSRILGIDSKRRDKWQEILDHLPDWPIGPDGTLLEWADPTAQENQDHRHVSHTYGLFPGESITPEHEPELVESLIKAVKKREAAFEGEAVGWTYPWLAALYARAGMGDEAYRNLVLFCQGFLTSDNLLSTLSDLSGQGIGRTRHGRMIQIEAGLGATTAICEMLLQSQRDLIRILPALPREWDTGEVQGLCARGGFDIDIRWDRHRATAVNIKSRRGGLCRVKFNRPLASPPKIFDGKKLIEHKNLPLGIIQFETGAEHSYQLLSQ
ncbi:MAG: glycoside hydrolase N-terminal domain-containing protein [Pirellulales bacterium]|nr:glycoside hydrolase N-terminal domain-containing protein [Pirellulales bacterium]